jgi:hypothetical protein
MSAWKKSQAVVMLVAALAAPGVFARSKHLKAANCEPRCEKDKGVCHKLCEKAVAKVKPALCFPICDKEAVKCVNECRDAKGK